MMFFSELYSAYYNAVAGILKEAVKRPVSKSEIRGMIENHAFGESVLKIEPALTEEQWQLLKKDGSTPIEHAPSMPMTTLEKRWLKAVYSDPRIKLFTDEEPDLGDVEPLFTADDYSVFDKYSDGDPFEDEKYIKTFRLILDAIKNKYPLSVYMTSRSGGVSHIVMLPYCLEYSEKDDKFRVISASSRFGGTVNLGRIVSCERYSGKNRIRSNGKTRSEKREVEFELIDQRSALERVLLHFAHFEKEAKKTGDNKYKVRILYDKDDESEIVIRILSFGPMVRVISPGYFTDLIKERLEKQKSCGL